MLHDLKELDLDPAAAGIDVVVSGHSHRPKIETVGGVLTLNPGSAGPRRFTLPIALATLELTADTLRPRLHHLGGPGSASFAEAFPAGSQGTGPLMTSRRAGRS